MFSGHAALTMETMREHKVAAQRRQRELDAEEVRALDAAASTAAAVPAAAPSRAPQAPRLRLVEG